MKLLEVKCLIAAAIALSGLLTSTDISAAVQECTFKLSACPESFAGQTIVVPENVIAFSPEFHVCKPTKVIEDVAARSVPPSIMFVIDHSNSMTGKLAVPRDSAGARFKVTSALIDTIYKKFPKAEVGLVIFQEQLYLDAANNDNFVALPSEWGVFVKNNIQYTTQAYLPLIRLDSIVSGGMKGVDFIKSLLETRRDTIMDSENAQGTKGITIESTFLKYKPDYYTNGNTNINVAFDAAKLAMSKTENAKDNQFVIFLSDGEPNHSWPQQDKDYFEGGIGMPATFTVYFVLPGESVPKSIAAMTKNIQENDYSKSNALSGYWGMQASYDSLLNLLMNNALNSIFSTIKQEPTRLLLNNVPYTDYCEGDSAFYIPGGVPLNDSITKIDMSINYIVRKDSSLATYDSIVTLSFTIERNDSKAVSDGLAFECKDTSYFDVSVYAADSNASEDGKDSGVIEFRRTNPQNGDLTVYYQILGTAINSADYITINDSISFSPAAIKQSIEIKPFTDALVEGDETVIIKILGSKQDRDIPYSVIEPDSAIVIIHDAKKTDTARAAVLINPFLSNESINSQLSGIVAKGRISNAMAGKFIKITKGEDFGTLISVQTKIPVKSVGIGITGDSIYGIGQVYDAVGNKVKKLDILGVDAANGIYGLFWDGTNKNNRKAGTGVYLLRIKFTSIDEKSNELNLKIGVKNK